MILKPGVVISSITLAGVCLFGACKTTVEDDHFRSTISGGGGDLNKEYSDLTMGEDGLIRAVVSKVISPTTVDINFKFPRRVRFPGVAGPDPVTQPALETEAKSYLLKYLGQGNPVFIRPLPGTNLKDETKDILGYPLLVAGKQPDPEQPLFADPIQGMLSLGLLRVSNATEFDRPEVARQALAAEASARAARVGMWKTR